MQFCTHCVLPETRPGINFDENGVCNFCRYYDTIDEIDWKQRKAQLVEIAEAAKAKKAQYDCVVGVSGGKDSTMLALYARDELGMNVLLANMLPDGLTDIGRHNLDNLQRMGFDCISFRSNPKVCRALAKMAFYKWCNPVKPSEYMLYATPVRTAIMFQVPLVIFDMDNTYLDEAKKYKNTGGDASNINRMNTLGYTGDASHLLCDGVTEKDLVWYQFPSREDIEAAGVKIIYYGYFVRWSPHTNAMFAMDRGLKIRTDPPEELGSYTRYHSLDDDVAMVNQMLKHLKMGWGFVTNEACIDLWAGRIDRAEAVRRVRAYDGKCGVKYIRKFCDYIGITLDEFWRVADSFRGPLWTQNSLGEWVLKEQVS